MWWWNEVDIMDVADTAVIGGQTVLGPGEQQDFGGRCRGGRGFGFRGGRGISFAADVDGLTRALRLRRWLSTSAG
jgi:hypothetical protein